MRLLPLEAFAHVFAPLRDKYVGFIPSRGNVGDRLIDAATFQLFKHFGVNWQLADLERLDTMAELVFGGGGNMGRLYPKNTLLRQRLLDSGKPVTVLPQSFSDFEERPFKNVYVRERASQRFCPKGILAPDLALGFDPGDTPAKSSCGLGLFLRRDPEGVASKLWGRCDPIKLCRTPAEYLALAAAHEWIITDRLHFAIAALITRRNTILLPNAYHKNESMHATWLGKLGCRYATTVSEALRMCGVAPRKWFIMSFAKRLAWRKLALAKR
ncbi:MAG TPA: polysaccharide pyruvyl transferase family protein [Gemmataceae bacterium]|nr:polysaccharide pyruvyl transferase family protein [Gemmataceae bacterium]